MVLDCGNHSSSTWPWKATKHSIERAGREQVLMWVMPMPSSWSWNQDEVNILYRTTSKDWQSQILFWFMTSLEDLGGMNPVGNRTYQAWRANAPHNYCIAVCLWDINF